MGTTLARGAAEAAERESAAAEARRAAEVEAHAANARAEEAEELAARARAAGESQRAKLVAAQRAAEESAERADRAETEAQEAWGETSTVHVRVHVHSCWFAPHSFNLRKPPEKLVRKTVVGSFYPLAASKGHAALPLDWQPAQMSVASRVYGKAIGGRCGRYPPRIAKARWKPPPPRYGVCAISFDPSGGC